MLAEKHIDFSKRCWLSMMRVHPRMRTVSFANKRQFNSRSEWVVAHPEITPEQAVLAV
jgi:hypothetical protein